MKTATYIGKLRTAGVPPDQAQAMGEALEQTLGDDYVTTQHLDAKVAEINAKFAELETRLIRAMVAQGLAVAGIVIAASKLFS